MASFLFARIVHFFESMFVGGSSQTLGAAQTAAKQPVTSTQNSTANTPHCSSAKHINDGCGKSCALSLVGNTSYSSLSTVSFTSSCSAPQSPAGSDGGAREPATVTTLALNPKQEAVFVPYRKREQHERVLESTFATLFRRYRRGQAVVMGKLPSLFPKAEMFIISEGEDVPPCSWAVRCRTCPSEWPTALMLEGFDCQESTVWFLQLQSASDTDLINHLRAVAALSTPCSMVLLLTWSPSAAQVVDAAGFYEVAMRYGAPLYILRRKESLFKVTA